MVKVLLIGAEYMKTRDICFPFTTLFFYHRHLILALAVNVDITALIMSNWPKNSVNVNCTEQSEKLLVQQS